MAPQTTSGSSVGATAPNLHQASGPRTQSHSGAVVAQMAAPASQIQAGGPRTQSHSGAVVAQMAAPAPRAQAMAPQTTSGSSVGATVKFRKSKAKDQRSKA